MKLLFVIDDLFSGGAQRQVVSLATVLAKLGHEVDLAVYGERDFYGEVLKRNKIGINKLVERSPIKRILIFRKFIRNRNFDIVISFLGVPNFICELAAFPKKKWKLIVNERSADPVILKSFKSRFRRLFHLSADFVICNSFANKEIVLKANPFLKAEKIKVIYNIVNLDEWKPSLQYKFLQEGSIHILIAASHRHLKNLMGLLKALLVLSKDEQKKIRISWYGNNLEAPFLDDSILLCKDYLRQNNLGALVTLYPGTHDICRKMQCADIIALFSFFEGLPNSICEGMALGKPILASAVSDIPRIIEDEINGKLFDPRDSHSIANAIRFYLQLDRSEYERMGMLNRAKALELFDENKIAPQFLDLIM